MYSEAHPGREGLLRGKTAIITGGEGSIDVFQRTDPSHYEKLARIPSAVGGRTGGCPVTGRR